VYNFCAKKNIVTTGFQLFFDSFFERFPGFLHVFSLVLHAFSVHLQQLARPQAPNESRHTSDNILKHLNFFPQPINSNSAPPANGRACAMAQPPLGLLQRQLGEANHGLPRMEFLSP